MGVITSKEPIEENKYVKIESHHPIPRGLCTDISPKATRSIWCSIPKFWNGKATNFSCIPLPLARPTICSSEKLILVASSTSILRQIYSDRVWCSDRSCISYYHRNISHLLTSSTMVFISPT